MNNAKQTDPLFSNCPLGKLRAALTRPTRRLRRRFLGKLPEPILSPQASLPGPSISLPGRCQKLVLLFPESQERTSYRMPNRQITGIRKPSRFDPKLYRMPIPRKLPLPEGWEMSGDSRGPVQGQLFYLFPITPRRADHTRAGQILGGRCLSKVFPSPLISPEASTNNKPRGIDKNLSKQLFLRNLSHISFETSATFFSESSGHTLQTCPSLLLRCK
jgi:hypothetical protein